jgi:hypothetical protein
MRFRYQRPDALITFLCIAWIVILGGLGLSAIILESVTISTKVGLSHSEGLAAIVEGCIFIGFALIGFLPFLAPYPSRRFLIALLFGFWLVGSIAYIIYK